MRPRVRAALAIAPALALAGCGRIGFDPANPGDAGGDPALRDDELPGEFGAGTFTDTTYAGGVVLTDGAPGAGTFASRVFALPAGAHAWSTIAWQPDAPYGKALPDLRGRETGYPRDNLDMAESITVLHLDGTVGDPIDVGGVLGDSSGRGNDFAIVASGMPGGAGSYVTGLVGGALAKGKNLYGSHAIVAGDDFQFGTRDFTWALWVATTYCSPQNTTFWGTEDADAAPHIWLGCGPCAGNPTSVNGYYVGDDGGVGVTGCGGPTIDDTWHHVAVTKTSVGTSDVAYTSYLDGAQIAQGLGPASQNVVWTSSAFTFTAFDVANFPDSTAPGQFDEAALWTRALDAGEIAAAYARVALDLSLQVRFCTAADCSDAPAWVGPDGTGATVFRDGTALAPPGPAPLAAIATTDRPFAQYKLAFARRAPPPASPLLHAVQWSVN